MRQKEDRVKRQRCTQEGISRNREIKRERQRQCERKGEKEREKLRK